MQPQGLAALMQPGQPAPQMNNPRMAAAMDVVTSDAEKQILDPRTLAMLKYKDAVQAMQAADQMMAAAQPQPMPPTVAERTKLAAEQGIAGLAQRLAPGVQQRGNQMATQQMRQAMAGGLPQAAAPNMTRMAGGGIVAFAPGGDVEAAQPKDFVPMLQRENQPTTLAELLAEAERYERIKAQAARAEEQRRARMEAGYGVPVSDGGKRAVGTEYLDSETGEPLPFKDRLSKLFNLDSEPVAPTPALPRDLGVTSIMPGGVARTVETPTSSAEPAPSAAPAPSGIEAVLARMQAPESQQVRRATAAEPSGLQALVDQRLEAQLQPGFVDERGQAIEERAAAAYAVPKEMRDLIQARIAQMEKPEFTPEELRDRRIQAWLQGLASSPYIAESGVAAAQGREAVMERSRQDAKERADKQFELAYDLMGKDREASMNAFKDGLAASDRAMAQVTGAVQSAAGMISSELTREQAALIQESQNNMEALKAQAAAVQASIERGQKDVDQLNSYYENLVRESDNIAQAIASIQQNSTPVITPEMQGFLDTLQAKKTIVDEQAAATRLQLGSDLGVGFLTPELESAINKYLPSQ